MRTFCYVADSVTGYIKVLVKGHSGEGYNVGTETPEISMRDLARKIAAVSKDLFGYAGKVVTKSSSDADYLIAQAKGAPSWRWELYKPYIALALEYDLPIVAANLARADAMSAATSASATSAPAPTSPAGGPSPLR